MAKNKEAGDDRRVGAVKKRSQIRNKLTGTWTKRDDTTGKFLDVKDDAKPFKGVRKKGLKTMAKKVAAKKKTVKKAAKKPAAKKTTARRAVKRVVKKAPARKAAKRR
jgi:response regulator of citrate/malate metabolism